MSVEALGRFVTEIGRAQAQLAADEDELLDDLGVSAAKRRVMEALAAAPGPKTVAQLSRILGSPRQGVQRLADALVGSGHLACLPNPDHQRAKLVTLTDRGGAVVDEARRRKAAHARRLARGLSAEWLEIGTELARLIASRSAKAAGLR